MPPSPQESQCTVIQLHSQRHPGWARCGGGLLRSGSQTPDGVSLDPSEVTRGLMQIQLKMRRMLAVRRSFLMEPPQWEKWRVCSWRSRRRPPRVCLHRGSSGGGINRFSIKWSNRTLTERSREGEEACEEWDYRLKQSKRRDAERVERRRAPPRRRRWNFLINISSLQGGKLASDCFKYGVFIWAFVLVVSPFRQPFLP